MAGQRARTRKRHRAGAGNGIVGRGSAGELAGIAARAGIAGRDARGKVSCQREGIEKTIDSRRSRADAGKLRRGCRNFRRTSELSAPADPEPGVEGKSAESAA